ncbi:MAG: hypothetical protein ABSH05_00555 [Bryobacteraceae bacterium]|jgi:hypothetical protein
MSNPAPRQNAFFLTAEDEERAIEAALSVSLTERYVAEAEQAIGQVLSIDTNQARPILAELVLRKRIEARPAAGSAVNEFESPQADPNVRAKWYRTNTGSQ